LTKKFKSTGALLQLEIDLAADPLSALNELGAGSAAMHIKVHVFSLPHETVQYISVDRIRIEGQGRGKKNKETAIPYLEISSTQASKVLENFDNDRERWDFI
jgi:precorrin-6B methylase 2